MKLIIDTVHRTIRNSWFGLRRHAEPLYSKQSFKLLSSIWIRQQWNHLHWKSFSWFGFEIWQLPEDLLRLQEVLVSLKVDVIIETGVNRGGSAIFFATICRLLGVGRVISIDIEIPSEVKDAIERSPFGNLITLIEGDSASAEVVDHVRRLVKGDEKVFVFLDSDHSKKHVAKELEAYAALVTPGSYLVATDGVMEHLADTPHGSSEWVSDNPAAAAREFVVNHPEFVLRRPPALFGDEYVIEELTYWHDAWLLRTAD